MQTFPATAIVLKRTAYRESDLRSVLYSREAGKIELVVRGAKKIESRLAPHIEPLNLVRLMVIKGRGRDYAASAICERSFSHIKGSLEKLNSAGEALRALDHLVKRSEADCRIFNLFESFLALIDNPRVTGAQSLFMKDIFILKLIAFLGLMPEICKCAICGAGIEPDGNRFDPEYSGLVCGKCEAGRSAIKISGNCIKIMRIGIGKEFKALLNLQANDSFKKAAFELESVCGLLMKWNI
jgi:DNA repair protein RecO (recombination protein O)